MRTANGIQTQQTQALDWIFAQCPGGRGFTWPAVATGRPAVVEAVRATEALPLEEVEPPPALRDPTDLRAANEWLLRERKRLQEYTRVQLGRIQAEHQGLLSRTYLNEQTLLLRSQELSSKEELLGQQARLLQQQTVELSHKEQTLTGKLEEWCRVQHDLANLCQARSAVEQDTEEQRALLDTLRSEGLALQQARAAAQAELETLGRALDQQRESRAKEQALVRTTRPKWSSACATGHDGTGRPAPPRRTGGTGSSFAGRVRGARAATGRPAPGGRRPVQSLAQRLEREEGCAAAARTDAGLDGLR